VSRPGAGVDAFLSGRVAGFKRPRSWSVRDELPRTESGKLLKRVLRAELEMVSR
jgi:acyl-coenzyme A synthetase/AMP-(fatty) acid ligase